MYNKVILATDGSENAIRAEARLIELAKNGSIAQIVVFHSILHKLETQISISSNEANYMLGPMEGISSELYTSMRTELENAGQAILDEAKRAFDAEKIPVETRLITNFSPEQYISTMIEEEGFDLIVLGCRGNHSRMKEMFLGTVPTRVLHATLCDVLIVR
ncbi:MAG TPA: universal stress protein [Candidatus Lokiarchaeia archaeon]|nr:universal stress protein [Candidatus Lokiarchaeia archaeon]